MSDLRQAAEAVLDAWFRSGSKILEMQPHIETLAGALEQPQCNPHPKAPHGFLRNASHTEDRYVCECEYWDPYEAGYQAGMEAAMQQQKDDDWK